ncbi:uncharacterized protein LOC111385962 isoform X1 [Olea europaea var. sylvestris]|uniref:Uncharacterized protein n=1 Tax=Olea europaea subsp. europaea TaxID=158383 RepID=A0A8S0REY8_OLEEU|nr:uncharacterized protein LOC111385962 isoform X1 [Olea europaea var. sylvestris]CAA2977632.1 Hypothetical predicted protein [Olea europaea subsp. europaea]
MSTARLHLAKMKKTQDPHNTSEINPANQASHESINEQPKNAEETPVPDSGSVSASTIDNRKVSREDIELVQNLIERCLLLYMNRDEVVKTLLNSARIDAGFTTLVWQKLEEENAVFFRGYYIRLKLKKQILLFNHLLEHQYHLMKYPMPTRVPLAPMQNGIHPMPVNNLPMGYPILHQPPVPATGQSLLDYMGYSTNICHVVNGVPAPGTGNFHPMRMNSGNDMVIDTNGTDAPAMTTNNAMLSISDMPVSPTSVASSGHFPFIASEISSMGIETSAFDMAFTSDVASSVGLQLPADNGNENSRDSLSSWAQISWNFSLSDLTADLSSLGELGALGNSSGSPFLHSDSDILLDSPDRKDIVEEFFIDSVPGQSSPPLDEEKSQLKGRDTFTSMKSDNNLY